MTKIGLLGDVHGDWGWTRFALWNFHRKGIRTVLQAGDFALYQDPKHQKFIKRVGILLKTWDMNMVVVPGNHEDWDYINMLCEHGTKTPEGFVQVRTDIPNLVIAPRGHRWEWEGVRFLAVSGAPSVDRTWQQEDQAGIIDPIYHTWFEGELLTWDEVEAISAGGVTDVLIGHDAPDGVQTIEAAIKRNPHGFPPQDLLYAADGRNRYTHVFRAVAPDTVIHGHYHFPVNEHIVQPNRNDGLIYDAALHWTQIFGLGCNGQFESMGHYETDREKRGAYHWDIHNDLVKYHNEGFQLR